MKPLIAGLVLAAVVLGACNGPTPTPTPTPPPTPTPTASAAAAAAATLVVTADGTVKCRLFPHGCLASLLIEPGNWTPPADWEPTDETLSFGAHPDPWQLQKAVAFGTPATIAPGAYTFGIGISEINDIAGDPNHYLQSEVKCSVPLLVAAETTSVTVHFNLDQTPCADLTIETD